MTSPIRLAVTLAVAIPFAAPWRVDGQIRTGRPAHPPAPVTSKGRPSPYPVSVPWAPSPGARPMPHRPAPCRSSIMGLVVFDPYWWSWDAEGADVNAPVVAPAAQQPGPLGGVQLDVVPWRALVYVDGLFAGFVEDFNGYYHHLNAIPGTHIIAMAAPGYDPLIIEVVVSEGQTTTYRGSLNHSYGRD